MNSILKIAVSAVIAGAVVALLIKQQRSRGLPKKPSTAGLGRHTASPWISPLEEVTDEHAVWGGGSSGLN